MSGKRSKAMRRAAIAVVHRISLGPDAGRERIETAVSDALDALESGGVTLGRDTVMLTIGQHPDWPGRVTVEAKAMSVSEPPLVGPTEGGGAA